MNYYTYRYTDPSRNEVIYIGKGKGRRAYHHLTKTNKHPFVQRLQYMKKIGVKPIIDFIAKDVAEEFALLIEEEAIALYGRKDLGKGPLLNLTNGGESESGIIRLSQRKPRPPEVIEKIKIARSKQVFDDAAKKKMSISAQNRKLKSWDDMTEKTKYRLYWQKDVRVPVDYDPRKRSQ